MKMMKMIRRIICAVVGHKPKLIYDTYVRDGRRFIQCCPLYRCQRCRLVYYGFGMISPEMVALIATTLKDLPPTEMFANNQDYEFSRLYTKGGEKNNEL